MDLVDEKNVAFLEVGEYGGQIAGTLDSRPARGLEGDAHFVGHHAGKRGLAQTRGPGKKQVVKGLAARFGSLDQNGEIFFDARLAKILGQSLRAQPRLGGGLLACLRWRDEALCCRRICPALRRGHIHTPRNARLRAVCKVRRFPHHRAAPKLLSA